MRPVGSRAVSAPDLLRDRAGAGGARVSFVELFFDLVFVLSITQLAHALAYHFTPLGALETLVMALAVWWAWIYTTWCANWLDPERGPVRAMLIALMFLGLLLSTSIGAAFGDRGLMFALGYVGMQAVRTGFMLWAVAGRSPANFRNFQRIGAWQALAGLFWIGGGLAGPEYRLALWLIATVIDQAAPASGFWTPGLGRSSTADWDVSGAHIAERCALFVIICFGEIMIAAGREFADAPATGVSLAAFAVAFVTAVALWWVYFRFGHHRAAHRIETSDDPGRIARIAFTYAHTPIVIGVIVTAVGSEFLLKHPADPAAGANAIALIAGPAIYVAGNLWFKSLIYGRAPLSHMAASRPWRRCASRRRSRARCSSARWSRPLWFWSRLGRPSPSDASRMHTLSLIAGGLVLLGLIWLARPSRPRRRAA